LELHHRSESKKKLVTLFWRASLEPLKTAQNIVKTVGPQGGFRYLSYEYINEHGTLAHAGTGSKTEAERLEMFFAKHNIPIKIEKAR
jgi:hypothetical protein